jgi:hypothetical protein
LPACCNPVSEILRPVTLIDFRCFLPYRLSITSGFRHITQRIVEILYRRFVTTYWVPPSRSTNPRKANSWIVPRLMLEACPFCMCVTSLLHIVHCILYIIHCTLYIVYCLLGSSPASEFCKPTFRDIVSVPSS